MNLFKKKVKKTQTDYKNLVDYCELDENYTYANQLSLEIEQYEGELEKINKLISKTETLAGAGNWELDLVNKIGYWSDEAYKIYGLDKEQFDHSLEGFMKIVHPEDRILIENMLENPRTEPFDIEFRIIDKQGSIRYIYQRVEFVYDSNDNPSHVYGNIKDITDQIELQRALEMNHNEIDNIKRKIQALIQKSKDIFLIISSDGFIKYANQALLAILGYNPNDVMGISFYDLLDDKDLSRIKTMIDPIVKGKEKVIRGKFATLTKYGKRVYFDAVIQDFLDDPAIEGYVINLRDISIRRRLKREMAILSYHDELTKLPNANLFKKCLNTLFDYAKEKDRPFALMKLDINGLKYINYSLGHDIGDRLVIDIAHRLNKLLIGDAFIARSSGMTFDILVLGVKSKNDYELIANEIIDLFRNPFLIEGYQLDVSANLGICIFDKNIEDAKSIKKRAQIALIRASKNGINKYKFHSSDLDIQNYRETTLRNDLHYAIDRDQFSVDYQPVINLNTNEIISAEAMIRWDHPEWGVILPNEFLPMAEENGMIIQISKWLLEEVCKNYRKWNDNKLPSIKVGINIPSIQFLEIDFVEKLKLIIDKYNLDYDFLIAEIRESAFSQKTDKVASDIESLQALGIKIAFDDFGKSFSSISMLSNFPIDIIKVDGSFIKDLTKDKANTSITNFLIDLAKSLDIGLVIEGIESGEQLAYLKNLNCPIGQGPLFCKPIPISNFEEILGRKRCYPKVGDSKELEISRERRKLFRIKFYQLLEAKLTILEINKSKVNVGNTNVLIKDIGPGGLCFISNIKFPLNKGVVLRFATELIDREIDLVGYPVWMNELENGLYEHGVKFAINEVERVDLIQILNQVEIKMRKEVLFAEGNFISGTYLQYFNEVFNRN